jgi:hypothetical protein
MGIEENLKARLAAKEIMEWASDEAFKHGDRLWEELARLVSLELPSKQELPRSRSPLQPMADIEAKRFGKQLMPYGEFSGWRVDNVPLERLAWYADQTFTDDLRRYLKSERVKLERFTEMEE